MKKKNFGKPCLRLCQLFCWQLPCLLQHLRQYRQKQQMCRQKQLMKMS
ncbi:MAG: hypothetical protein ACLTTO_08365 [Lachnospiraceae bacterium]